MKRETTCRSVRLQFSIRRLTSLKFFRRLISIIVASLLVSISLPVLPTGSVLAFKPTNRLRKAPLDETHENMTDDTIVALAQSLFGVSRLTKSMTKALDQIEEANKWVDVGSKFLAPEYHFDNELFNKSQNNVVAHFNQIIAALKANQLQLARKKLGEALHTIQDFYSHTNWVELGNTTPNVALGRPGRVITPVAVGPTCRACTPCFAGCKTNVIATSLTSGYFEFNNPTKPAGKCSHGGPWDQTAIVAPSGGINKDTSDCNESPHSHLHAAAVAVARDATKQFLLDIQAKVTARQFKALLGVGPTLAIAIDTTGSMGSIIASVKQQAIQIIDNRIGTDEEPIQYVLAPFNDPGVGPVTVTDDPAVFKKAINALTASGGGDCPELSNSGALLAMGSMDPGGDLFIFTDASAKDTKLATNVSSLAFAKEIKIYPILFGSCSPIDPSYIRAANDSGGQLFFLSRLEAGNITRLADLVSRSNAVELLSIGDSLSGTAQTYFVPVDSTMTSATFSVSGATSVVVKRPDRTTVKSGDAGVSFIPLSSGAIYSLATPATGTWSITVNGGGTFSIRVTGESSMLLNSFKFVEPGGRPGHEGMFTITGFPITGQTAEVNAIMTEGFNTAQFELRSKAGEVLQTLDLTRDSGVAPNAFYGEITPPDVPFSVYVTGADVNGIAYQRVLSNLIRPQPIKIIAPGDQTLRPGQTAIYTFQVKNFGPVDTFRFIGADDQGFLRSISPSTFNLNTGETINVTVQLTAPAGATPGTINTLTASVESTGDADVHNFAVVESEVPAISEADLAITQTAFPNPVTSGSKIVYSVNLTNNGPSEAEAITVTDSLPSETTFVSCTATGGGLCDGTGNQRTVSFPSLAPGESANITFVAQVYCNVVNATPMINKVTVNSSTSDPDLTNNEVTTTSIVTNPPPTITSMSVDKAQLWPPNHKMENVTVDYDAADNCSLPTCELSVSSNEPINGTGDGDTSPDWLVIDAHHVRLRSERKGNGNGRIYTITIRCTDSGGNSSNQQLTVKVSKDRSP